ncbi:hypothetical protein ES703_11423 [subsurface metagenome]
MVHADDHSQAVLLGVVHRVGEDGQAFLNLLGVGLLELAVLDARVPLQRLDGGYYHNQIGLQPTRPGCDVAELLHAQIGSEAGLHYDVGRQLEGGLDGGQAGAAVGDVGEGTAVDYSRCVLKGLHQVWLHRLLHEDGHCTYTADLLSLHRIALAVVGDGDLTHPLLAVHQVAADGVDCRYLAGRSDLEARLIGDPAVLVAEADDDLPEDPGFNVQHALPHDRL